MTADADGLQAMTERLPALLDRLPPADRDRQEAPPPPPPPADRGVIIPVQVSYVARAMPAPPHGHRDTAALMVASRFLSNGYLYKTIRVQGGAYGGMSAYDPQLGVFAFMSYRDPHISRTLRIYEEAAAALKGEGVSRDDLDKAIIGAIGLLDRPLDPAGKGMAALIRHLSSLTDPYRQALRHEILELTGANFRAAVIRFLEAAAGAGAVAVFSSAERLQQANELRDENKLLLEAIE